MRIREALVDDADRALLQCGNGLWAGEIEISRYLRG